METGNFVLYLDTSAIVKLYVEEEHSDTVGRAIEEAWGVHTSALADLEVRCTLARLRHEGEFKSDDELEAALGDFRGDWDAFHVHPYREDLARRGGELAKEHTEVRAYDALHLATALAAFEDTGALHFVAPDLRFLAFDCGLVRAARRELTLHFDPFPEQAEQATEE